MREIEAAGRGWRRIAALAFAALTAAGSMAAPAMAADAFRTRAYTHHADPRPAYGHLPECDSPSVLAKVRSRFAYADRHIYHTGTMIGEIDQIRDRGPGMYTESLIAKRYCSARAYLDNATYQPVHYLIEARAGFVGITWNVESCLPGWDRWHVYGGWCRVLSSR